VRIGIDLSSLTSNRTGVGSFTYYMTKHLLAIATDATFSGFSSGLHPIVPGALKGCIQNRHLKLPTRALYKLWEWTGFPRVDAFLGGTDVFHATNYYLPPVKSSRRVLTIYDLAFMKNPHWGSPKIVGPFSKALRHFAHQADAVITCSKSSKLDIVDRLYIDPAKITVTYGAVDDTFHPVSRPEAVDYLAREHGIHLPFILYVGTLEPRKNIDGVLDSFAQIKDDFPHSLVLTGQAGWNMEHLEDRIRDLGLVDRIHRVGYLPHHFDLANFYSAAELFFFPSFDEGFGLPVLEAMTCGCPVVCSGRGALPEVAGDAAQQVNPDDVETMATTLRMVLMNERLRGAMTQRGLVQAKQFTWASCAEQTLSVYRGLLG